MRIKNAEIYSLIAELWNASACATDAREQAWCAESVQAEVRASGMTPDEALRGAVSALCTLCAATVARCNLIEYWGWDDADDDDVVYEEDDDGDGDYVEEENEENEEDEDGYGI